MNSAKAPLIMTGIINVRPRRIEAITSVPLSHLVNKERYLRIPDIIIITGYFVEFFYRHGVYLVIPSNSFFHAIIVSAKLLSVITPLSILSENALKSAVSLFSMDVTLLKFLISSSSSLIL